jgi:hypothetical protein
MSVSIFMCGNYKVFIELAQAIKQALYHMKHNSEIYFYQTENHREMNNVYINDCNIFIQGHRIDPPKGKLNIMVQPEQFWKESQWQDYSHQNWDLVLEFFPKFLHVHKNSKLLKLGYSSEFDNYKPVKQDIDIHFFGGITPYRQKWLTEFPNIYRKHPEAYGNDRDILISRSKLNVNLHVIPDYWVTPLRAMFVLSKGKMFFQENTKNQLEYLNQYITYFDKTNFNQIMKQWLHNVEERYKMENRIKLELIKNLNFNDTFKDAVNHLFGR